MLFRSRAHLRERLPATFLPTQFRQVRELPMTMTQKLDMGAVKALFAEGQSDCAPSSSAAT